MENTHFPAKPRMQLRVTGYTASGLAMASLMIAWFVSYRNTITPQGIILHHSALTQNELVLFGASGPSSAIEALHRKRGFSIFYWGSLYHTAYHYLILPDGRIEHARPEHCRGAHAPGYNSYLGICLIGNFSSRDNPDGSVGIETPTAAQLESLATLTQSLQHKYGLSCSSILRHQDVNPKTQCPGDRFPWQKFRMMISCDQEKENVPPGEAIKVR